MPPIDRADLDPAFARKLEATGAAGIVADAEGRIVYWDADAERLFGHPAHEVLGRTLDIIIPEKLRERHWHGYRRVMDGGATELGERTLAVPALHADGRRISIEFTINLFRDQ